MKGLSRVINKSASIPVLSRRDSQEYLQFIGPVLDNNKTSSSPFANDTTQSGPLCVYEDDTYWYTYYLGADNDANIDKTYLKRCLKTNDILDTSSWVRYGGDIPTEILGQGPSSWNSWQNYLTSIIKDGSTYHGYYSSAGTGSPGYYSIGHATSTDLLSWTRDNPDDEIITESGYAAGALFPRVIVDGGTWHMLYIAIASGTDVDLMYATSSDGLSWTKQGEVWANVNSNIGEIWKEGNKFYFTVPIERTGGVVGDWDTGYVTGGGFPSRYLDIYETTDFTSFKKTERVGENDTGIWEGINICSKKLLDPRTGKNFFINNIYKNDSQEVINGRLECEEWNIGGIFISSAPNGYRKAGNKLYPTYINDIYPVFGDLVSKLNRYSGSRTGDEDNRFFQTNYFDTGEYIDYSYRVTDGSKFAVKLKVTWPSASVATHTFLEVTDVFKFSHEGGVLRVYLKGDNGNEKVYTSNVNLYSLFPELANGNITGDFPVETIDIGFIFNNGTLQICAGYNADIATTKSTDESFTVINDSQNNLRIGNGSLSDLYPVILLGEVSDQNWIDLNIN